MEMPGARPGPGPVVAPASPVAVLSERACFHACSVEAPAHFLSYSSTSPKILGRLQNKVLF